MEFALRYTCDIVADGYVLTTLTAIAIGLLAAMGARLMAGRLAGLSMTAICGATMAYLLPPAFSFRVSEPRDVAALAIYGTIGLVLASPPRGTRKRARPSQAVPPSASDSAPSESQLERVIPELMGSAVGARIRESGITVDGRGPLPWAPEEAVYRLSAVLEAAMQDPRVREISIYSGRCPGDMRVFVAAYHSCPPQNPTAVTIGKRHEDCETAVFPGWLPDYRATWFGNPCGRVYQISRR